MRVSKMREIQSSSTSSATEEETVEGARTTTPTETTSTSSSLSKDLLPKEIGSCSKDELDTWLADIMKLPEQKMKLEYFKEEGRGLVATESIKRGEKVLEIPQEAIITVEVALKESLLREKKKLA